jgi:cell wall-associated NlpC family hydrolase
MMRIYLIVFLCLTQWSSGHSFEPKSHTQVLDKLQLRYDMWQGTDYQIGGLSRKGIDCSGFVQLAYSDEFNIQLPRTTSKQSQVGTTINKEQLMAGDLVFFKIPKQGKMYHVGIYLENNLFLHASTSLGVTISNLNNNYWSKNYWKSQRVD